MLILIPNEIPWDVNKVLSNIFSQCFSEGKVSLDLKTAIFTPLPKTKGSLDDDDLSNFRPISNVLLFSYSLVK